MFHFTFPDGNPVMTEKVNPYLVRVLSAEKSNDPFPVDFDLVWPFGYTTRSIARTSLIGSREFCEGKDYRIHLPGDVAAIGRESAGRSEKIMLSVQCFEYFISRSDRTIFEIYRQCRLLISRTL
jgi:hypothetical protein